MSCWSRRLSLPGDIRGAEKSALAERSGVHRDMVSEIDTGAYAGAQRRWKRSDIPSNMLASRRCARCETEKAMTDAWGRLHVEVLEDEIVITLPFTNYTVTYYKPATSPGLLAKNFPTKDDSRVPLTQAEFLERAWKLANNKARALGWIA
jgi:hypothetical protein